jgi:hypothetical protein
VLLGVLDGGHKDKESRRRMRWQRTFIFPSVTASLVDITLLVTCYAANIKPGDLFSGCFSECDRYCEGVSFEGNKNNNWLRKEFLPYHIVGKVTL